MNNLQPTNDPLFKQYQTLTEQISHFENDLKNRVTQVAGANLSLTQKIDLIITNFNDIKKSLSAEQVTFCDEKIKELSLFLKDGNKDLKTLTVKSFDLRKIIDEGNFADLTQMINEGLVPEQNDINRIAKKALNYGQLYLLTQLVKKGLLTELGPDELQEIIQLGGLGKRTFAIEMIEALVAHGLSLKDGFLLKKTITFKDYALAAFLVKLGAPAEAAGDVAKGIEHYADVLKQGTETEQQLKRLTYTKNIANLVGDTIIADLMDHMGQPIEGNFTSESIPFISASIAAALEKHPELSSPELKAVRPRLIKMQELSTRFESLMQLEDTDQIDKSIDLIEKDVLKEIDDLSVGDALLIPGGWNKTAMAHAVAIECKLLSHDAIEITIINTGEGAEYHGGSYDAARLHLNTIRTYVISKDAFRNLHVLRKIFEPKSIGRGADFTPEDLYAVLDSHFIIENRLPNIRKAQLSGSCSIRSLLAYLKLKLTEDQYKSLKPLLSEQAIEFCLDLNAGLLDKQPALLKILHLATPHLSFNLLKRLEKPWVNLTKEEVTIKRLSDLDIKLKQTLPQLESTNETIPLDETFPTRFYTPPAVETEQVKNNITILNQEDSSPAPLPTQDIREIGAVSDLITHLNDVLKYSQLTWQLYRGSYNGLSADFGDFCLIEDFLTSTLRALGSAFLSDKHTTALRKVIEELKKNPNADESEQMISTLTSLAVQLRTIQPAMSWTTIKRENPARILALEYTLLVAWELTGLIEKARGFEKEMRVNTYGLDMSSFDDWHIKFITHPLMNTELEQDFDTIWAFKEEQPNSNPLFNFLKQTKTSGGFQKVLSLMPNIDVVNSLTYPERKKHYATDFIYAEALAKKHTDWTEADASYNKAVSTLSQTNAPLEMTLDEWRIHWLYSFGMPHHFQSLRELAFYCMATSIGSIGPKSDIKILELQPFNKSTNPDGKLTTLLFIKQLPYDFSAQTLYKETTYGFPEIAKKSDPSHLDFIQTRGQNDAVLFGENILLRETGSISAAVSHGEPFYSPLVAPLLLNFFGPQHIDELYKVDSRIFFDVTLFAPLRLNNAIESIPHFPHELKSFFENSMTHFRDRITTKINVKSSAVVLTFLLTAWQRTLLYLLQSEVKEIDGKQVLELLENGRKNIKTLQRDLNFQDLNNQSQLNLALMDSYNGEPFNIQEMCQDLIKSVIVYRKVENEIKRDEHTEMPAFVNSAFEALMKHKTTIQNVLKKDNSGILHEAVTTYGIKLAPHSKWEEKCFPVYVCNEDNDSIEVNVMTGKVLKNKLELVDFSLAIRENSPHYLELFGVNKLGGLINKGSYYETSDSKTQFHLVTYTAYKKICEITQNFEGVRFSYILKNDTKAHPALPPLPGINCLGIWRSPQNEYILANRTTLKPEIYVDKEGRLTFYNDKENISWKWVEESVFKKNTSLMAIDSSAFILQEDTQEIPRQMRLYLPNLVDDIGSPVEFEKREMLGEIRWVLRSKPHLMLSKQQTIKHLSHFKNFLILENTQGDLEAMIPIKTKEQLDKNQTVATSCISIKLNEDHLSSSEVIPNAYLAYLKLIYAKTPEDYLKAMEYSRETFKFSRYEEEELRLLQMIFECNKSTKDTSGLSDAVRLYIACLIEDNFKRNPKNKSKPIVTQEELEKLARHYFARQQHLPYGLRIDDPENFSKQEIIDLNLIKLTRTGEISGPFKEKTPIQITLNDLNLLIESSHYLNTGHKIPIHSRPSKVMKEVFADLFEAAKSNDPKRQKKAIDQFKAMRFDPNSRVYSALLFGVLNGNTKLIQLVETIMKNPKPTKNISNAKEKQKSDWISELTVLLNTLDYQYIEAKQSFFTPVAIKQILSEDVPITLPEKLPLVDTVAFTQVKKSTIDLFKRLFTENFIAEHSKEPLPNPFHYKTEDSWLNASMDKLNKDYEAGAKKNREIPHYRLKGDGITIEQLITTERDSIVTLSKNYSDTVLVQREMNILKIANAFSTDTKKMIKTHAERLAKRDNKLTIRDCIALFLEGDAATYKKKTSLTDSEEIKKFHHLIGEYIILSNEKNRCHEVIKALNDLKKTYEAPNRKSRNVDVALQRVARELNVETVIDPKIDVCALMVFEYGLGLTLKKHQVDGIRDMLQKMPGFETRFQSVLLQRIQGGGKSLVFGHIMALVKADGYHLSVHVPATPQYETSIRDMRTRSKQLFGQREQILTFDDDPLKFTPKYLTWIKNMLKEAIVNRNYVSITNESLRAMRCKYLKIRFEILKSSDPNHKAELEKSNQILKEILSLFRERAILTFDEMHLAFHSIKELNMPYGPCVRPEIHASHLIAKVMSLACLAKDADGPLLDIHDTALQSKEKYLAMCEYIIQGLTQEKPWNDLGVIAYLKGETPDVPPFLDEEKNKELAKLVILSRQMLVGNWLKSRLNTNVNEHHGISNKGYPLVSIPFVANMVPAEGSEFSDVYVMTTNTLLAYLTTQLTTEQTKELVELCRQAASAQKREATWKDPSYSIENTPMCQDFKKGTGIDLFSIAIEIEEDISSLQKALLQNIRKEEALKILYDYVINREISQVELYKTQVCSNGQNVASMAQSFVAYSASMENENMAPIGSVAIPEEGTNGQTIDLLISRNTVVNPLEDTKESLFELMKSNRNKDKIRTIIDAGAYFRGQKNEAVAKLICDYLVEAKSSLQGVLFFNDTGRLCFMQKNLPNRVKTLSETTEKVITEETGFMKDKLFTYYDQEHITGVDIRQDPETLGLVTMSEHTKIHQILQGARRLRELDFLQNIEIAVPKRALDKIKTTLKTSEEVPSIRDLLLYANIQEAEGQKPENRLYCLQKMENLIQQYILDKLLKRDEAEEKALFAETSYLFEKSVAIDLYKEYAHKRKTLDMSSYLNQVKESLIRPLEENMPAEELILLKNIIEKDILNGNVLKGLDNHIEISHTFLKEKTQLTAVNPNQETSRVQYREQQRVSISERLQVRDQNNLDEYLRQIDTQNNNRLSVATETPFTEDDFLNPNFGKVEENINVKTKKPTCWSLNAALKVQKNTTPLEALFAGNFLTTNNASKVTDGELSLLGPNRKKPWSLLVICDESKGTKSWKIILSSIQDAKSFKKYLDENDLTTKGRTMWLTSCEGKIMGGEDTLPIDTDKKLRLLITQSLFFTGDYTVLSENTWMSRIKEWFDPLENPEQNKWVSFFENEILMGIPPDYPSTPLYDYLHSAKT